MGGGSGVFLIAVVLKSTSDKRIRLGNRDKRERYKDQERVRSREPTIRRNRQNQNVDPIN